MSNLRSGDKLGNDDDVMTCYITQSSRGRVDDFGRQDACQDAAPGPGRSGRGGARPRARPNFSGAEVCDFMGFGVKQWVAAEGVV